MTPIRVLIVEDSEDDMLLLLHELARGGYTVSYERVETAATMDAALRRSTWDLILADHQMPHFNALAALALMRERGLDLPFIIVSGSIGEEVAVKAMQAGAHDYILKGNRVRLVPAIERELREAAVRRENRHAAARIQHEAARAKALLRVSARLNRLLDLPAVLQAVCEETAYALHVPVVAIFLYDVSREQLVFSMSAGLLPAVHAQIRPIAVASYERLAHQIDPLLVMPDIQSVSNPLSAALAHDDTIRTVITARLHYQEQFVGLLSIATRDTVRHFDDEELALLRGLAEQATLALTNARLLDEAERRLTRMSTQHEIDVAITASRDLSVILDVVLTQIRQALGADGAAVLLLDPNTRTLEPAAHQGFPHADLPAGACCRMSESHAWRAVTERRTILIPHQEVKQTGMRMHLHPDTQFVSYAAVPLIINKQINGVLIVVYRIPSPYDLERVNFLESLATQTAIAVDHARLFGELHSSNIELAAAYDKTIEGWSRALDLRDKETEGHSLRVTEMTLRLARAIGVPESDLLYIRWGALLHDIGKMGIPDAILLKPGLLTEEEWDLMRKHPSHAYDLLSPIAFLRPALDIPYCHHEKWDGSGYPRGLQGEQIPLAARIFAIVDVWDALCSDRPYRRGWCRRRVIEHIRSQSGIHFDPHIVHTFLTLLERKPDLASPLLTCDE